jgi:hypothetical protein
MSIAYTDPDAHHDGEESPVVRHAREFRGPAPGLVAAARELRRAPLARAVAEAASQERAARRATLALCGDGYVDNEPGPRRLAFEAWKSACAILDAALDEYEAALADVAS